MGRDVHVPPRRWTASRRGRTRPARRAGDRRWDIAVGGWERRDDLDEELEHRRSVAEAGADWWVEWVAPAERAEMARAVVRGPLRVDQL